jgi:hypothetical protein
MYSTGIYFHKNVKGIVTPYDTVQKLLIIPECQLPEWSFSIVFTVLVLGPRVQHQLTLSTHMLKKLL